MQHSQVIPKDLTFQLLQDITNSFSEDHKVGRGGYGEVYKGVHNGEEIAVKKLYHIPGVDDELFKKEFYSLMRVQHHNIIRLVGYCYESRNKYVEVKTGEFVFATMAERALCFEYFQRGSLDKYLSDESYRFDWHTCYKIIKGICEGLDYLHNGSKDPMYHLDLKPANILLDENMTPKIADFGLARLFGTTQTHTTKTFIGTVGYMPPEYIEKRQISKKYDIFSLGVIIIQILAGPSGYTKLHDMSSTEFIELVHENWKNRLQTTSTYISWEADCLQVKACVEIALRCVEADRGKRPTIAEIINMLNDIDTVRKSTIAKSSAIQFNKEGFGIDPLELRFPFELNREISCALQLTNKSDGFIVFSARANQSKYSTQPDKGVLRPWSKRYIVVKILAQVLHTPPDMQCNDMFVVQSTGAHEGLSDSDVTEQLFDKMAGTVVDEVKLPIVYVALTQHQGP